MNLQELKAKEISLLAELEANQAAQYKIIKADFIAQNNGIDVGDTIKFIYGEECIGVVSEIRVVDGNCNYWINPLRSNGTVSKLQVRIYEKDRKTISLIKKAKD